MSNYQLGNSKNKQVHQLKKSEVRSQKFLTTLRRYRTEVVFETKIYAPSQKVFAFKGGVLEPIIFDSLHFRNKKLSSSRLLLGFFERCFDFLEIFLFLIPIRKTNKLIMKLKIMDNFTINFKGINY